MDTDLDRTAFLFTAIGLPDIEKLPSAWGRALDRADPSILEMILDEDAVVDLTRTTNRIGLEFPVLEGRSTAIRTLMSVIGPLDTMHLVSNVLVEEVEDGARVEAYALAQHFPPGQGAAPGSTRHALLGTTWTFDLRWTGERYAVVRLETDCLWMEGDPSVLLAAVS
jgi:hypothetical protein